MKKKDVVSLQGSIKPSFKAVSAVLHRAVNYSCIPLFDHRTRKEQLECTCSSYRTQLKTTPLLQFALLFIRSYRTFIEGAFKAWFISNVEKSLFPSKNKKMPNKSVKCHSCLVQKNK